MAADARCLATSRAGSGCADEGAARGHREEISRTGARAAAFAHSAPADQAPQDLPQSCMAAAANMAATAGCLVTSPTGSGDLSRGEAERCQAGGNHAGARAAAFPSSAPSHRAPQTNLPWAASRDPSWAVRGLGMDACESGCLRKRMPAKADACEAGAKADACEAGANADACESGCLLRRQGTGAAGRGTAPTRVSQSINQPINCVTFGPIQLPGCRVGAAAAAAGVPRGGVSQRKSIDQSISRLFSGTIPGNGNRPAQASAAGVRSSRGGRVSWRLLQASQL